MSHRNFLSYVGEACLGAGCVGAVDSLADAAAPLRVVRRAAPAVDPTLARDAEYVAWRAQEFTDVIASIAALRRRARDPAA